MLARSAAGSQQENTRLPSNRNRRVFLAQLQVVEDFGDRLGDRQLVGRQLDVRPEGRFVRRGNPGEFLDLVGAGFRVQAFGVALLADFDRRVHIDFDEFARRYHRAHQVAVRAVGRNERGDDDDARVGEQFGQFADATDVFLAVFGRETEVGTKAVPNVVAVEHISVPAQIEQFALQLDGNGGLARTGQAGEPDDAAAVAVAGGALPRGDLPVTPINVMALVQRVGRAPGIIFPHNDAAA